MERKFAVKGIRENKKRFAMTFAVLLLSSFLLQFCSVLQDSLEKSIVENRYDLYGSFRYSIEEYIGDDLTKRFTDFPCIRSWGTVAQLGTAGGAEIARMDDTALELGHIRLESGQMPQAEDEIAIEPAVLLANGYPAEIGQRVTLAVTGLQSPKSEKPPEMAELEFTVSGLLHEYTAVWGFGPGVLVSEEGCRYVGSYVGNLKQHTYLLDSTERPAIGNVQENKRAYPKDSLENVTTLLGYAIWMIAAVSMAILLVCMLFSVLKRAETWRFFRDLGAEKGQVQRIVLWEGGVLAALALPMGAVLGVLAAVLLMLCAPSPVGEKWVVEVSVLRTVQMLGLSFLAAAAGIVLPSCYVRKTPLLAGDRKTHTKQYRKRKKGMGFLSAFRLMAERMRAQRGMTALLTGILLSCGLAGALTVHMISFDTAEIRQTAQDAQNGELVLDRTYDRIDGMYDYFSIPADVWMASGNLPLSGEVIEEIENLYGVERVERYRIKTGDYNTFEPQFIISNREPVNEDGTARYAGVYYECNRELPDFGGTSFLFYMDLSDYADTGYFNAYISAEQARAATSLVYCGRMAHQTGNLFGKAISYTQILDTMPEAYYAHMPPGNPEPTEEEVEEYYQRFHIMQWDEMIPDTENCNATVWGVSGEEAEPVLEAAQGDIDLDAYRRGEECVLVLPDIYLAPQTSNPEPCYPPVEMDTWLMDWQYKYEKRDVGFYSDLKSCLFSDSARLQGYEIYREDSIQVGDMIPVKYLDETVNVRVGAILRELPQEAAGYPYSTLRPYTIVTGEDFFHRFEQFSCPDAYECITIKLNGKQPAEVVEMQIQQIIKPLNNFTLILSNLASKQESLEQEAWVNISTLALFAVLYFAVVLVVLSIVFSLSMESQRRRIAVLRALGMEVQKIRLSYLIESLVYSVIGFVGAVPVMLAVWGKTQLDTYGGGGPWLSYIMSDGCVSFLWWAYGLIFLVVTAGVLCTLYLPLRKFFKDSIIEQMQN